MRKIVFKIISIFATPNLKFKIMKKLILSVCALSLVMFTSCKEDASSKIKEENVAEAAKRDASAGKLPVIEFDKTEHDFGTIQDGTPVETVFSYTNVGDSPLVVTDIKSTYWLKESLVNLLLNLMVKEMVWLLNLLLLLLTQLKVTRLYESKLTLTILMLQLKD